MKMHSLLKRASVVLFTFFCLASCKETSEQIPLPKNQPDSSRTFTFEEAYPGRSGQLKEGKLFGQPIQYTQIENEAVFEGDIILTPDQLAATGDKNGRTSGAGRRLGAVRWPNNTVFYTIDPALPNQARVTSAIAHWQSKTPLRFVPRTTQTSYITFRPGDGCSSSVGRVGGQQFITLASGCSTGSTIHEIAHAVGFWHEQSRSDRDQYIKIHWENILPDKVNNFKTYLQLGADGFDYKGLDLGSIMMYSPYAFSKNGKPTITLLNGSLYAFQRNALSYRDIGCTVSMYANLYAVRNDRLYGINATNGQRADLGGQWMGTEALVSYHNALYGIQAGQLWRTDRLNGEYSSLGPDYDGTLGMAVVGSSLYTIQLGSLWRINPVTGAYVKVGTTNWNGTTAMTALNGYLYVVRGDILYRINPLTGSSASLGGSYQGTEEIAILNGSLYLIEGGSLWRVNPDTGVYIKVGTTNWSGTTAMTALSGYLYAVRGDVLYRVSPTGLLRALSTGWTGTQEMTSIASADPI